MVLSLLYDPILTSVHDYCTTKTIALTLETFIGKVMSLLFNTLSRFVIAFLPRSKSFFFNFMAVVTICSDFGSPQNSLSQFHLRRLSYLSLLFSESLHSDEYIFPFLPCLLLFFFPQLFVKLPQTTILSSCISFSLGGFGHCFLYNVMNLRP